MTELLSTLQTQTTNDAKQHTEQIVLSFGIDRMIETCGNVGSLSLIFLVFMNSISSPINCFREGLLVAEKSFFDEFCWENYQQVSGQGYDPRNLVDHLRYLLIIQLLLLQIPNYFWLSITGGKVKGSD